MNQYNGLQRRYRFFMTMRSISFLVLTLVIVSSSFVVLFTSAAKPAVASSQDGSLLWRYQTGDVINSTPAMVNGVLYFGSFDHYVYALTASTGALLWRYQTGDHVGSSPTVVNGVLYIGSFDHYMYALNASTGALLWRYQTGNGVSSSPTVVNGVLYVGSQDHYVYALNASTGALLWRYQTGNHIDSSPTVVNGVLYVGSIDGYVYALNASTGALLWRYQTGNYIDSSPTVVNGVLYIGSEASYVYALTASTGALLWRYQTGGGIYSSPTVVNGVLYIGSDDFYVYALTASTGALLWRYQTGGGVVSPKVINGVLYVGSYDHYVYALTAAGGPPPTPPPILPVASFTWNMAPRFGVVPSGRGSGLPMYPNDINRKTFTEQYDACGSTGNLVLYTWTYPGGSSTSKQCSGFMTNLPNGQQQVSLTVTDSAGRTSSPDTQMLQVQDFFIVSLGDSVASGEGNPDVAGQCAQPTGISFANQHTKCTVPPWWQPQYPGGHENPQCHRSTWAGSPQAALSLQNTYKHTSETFLHLACSGASIASGLLGPYAGIDNHNGSWADLPPQLQEVNTLRQGRPIDALLINIGANDINFSGILEECLILGITNPPGDCGTSATQAAIEYTFSKDLKTLSTDLDILGNCMTAGKTTCTSKLFLNVPANHIFINGYFDPARGSYGAFCDAGFGNGLSSNAWSWAENKILLPLNQLLGQKATAFGWHAIGDFNAPPYPNSFLQHGYCATQSGQPLDQSGTWIRQYYNDPNNVGDAYQGTFGMQGDHTGFMHPNYWGHQRYATSYVNALVNALPFR